MLQQGAQYKQLIMGETMKFTKPYIISGLSVLMSFMPISASADNDTSNDERQPETAVVSDIHAAADTAYVAGPRAVAVIVKANKITYIFDDSTRVTRIGGTLAWRSNNPGCLRDSDLTRTGGSIGSVRNFAVFPTEAAGMAAIQALLRTNEYKKLTLAQAFGRYAPPDENDTQAYRQKVTILTGLPMSKYVRELSEDQLQRVANAIRRIEGWRPGSETIDTTRQVRKLKNDSVQLVVPAMEKTR